MRGDAAGFGHPEAEPTKFTSIAEEKRVREEGAAESAKSRRGGKPRPPGLPKNRKVGARKLGWGGSGWRARDPRGWSGTDGGRRGGTVGLVESLFPGSAVTLT